MCWAPSFLGRVIFTRRMHRSTFCSACCTFSFIYNVHVHVHVYYTTAVLVVGELEVGTGTAVLPTYVRADLYDRGSWRVLAS